MGILDKLDRFDRKLDRQAGKVLGQTGGYNAGGWGRQSTTAGVKFVGAGRQDYNDTIKFVKSSSLFSYYFSILTNSPNSYTVQYGASRNFGGEYKPGARTVTLFETRPYVLVQELFHAYQDELAVYGPGDRSNQETEGDIMTLYVTTEIGIQNPSYGGWIDTIQQAYWHNNNRLPTAAEVNSTKYNNLFQQTVVDRIAYYTQLVNSGNSQYKGYTLPKSNAKPHAIISAFKGAGF